MRSFVRLVLASAICMALSGTARADETRPAAAPKASEAKAPQKDASPKDKPSKPGTTKPADPADKPKAAAKKTPPDLVFPEVEGWQHTDKQALDGGGFVINYRLTAKEDKASMTIFLYDQGLAKIPDDINGVMLQADLIAAKNAIEALVRTGKYDEAKEEDAGTVTTLGGLKDARKALHAQFRVKFSGFELISEIYDLPYKDYFFKIRADREAAAPERVKEAQAKLYAALEEMLAKGK